MSAEENLLSLTLSKYLSKQAAVKAPVDKAPGFDTALDRFLKLAQEMLDEHTKENDKELERLHPGKGWKTPRTILTAEHGKRYVRIVKSAPGQTSVYCFIDSTNGDVLKGASWKAPAPGVRGSIFAPNPIAGVGAYGARYFR
jgi:hypothetical protein